LEFSACRLGAPYILHNEEPDALYSSPKYVQFINQRRIRRDGHFALEGGKVKCTHGYGAKI